MTSRGVLNRAEPVSMAKAEHQAGFRARRVGRLRVQGEAVDPRVDSAVDRTLAEIGIEVRDVALPTWRAAFEPAVVMLRAEGSQCPRHLLARPDCL